MPIYAQVTVSTTVIGISTIAPNVATRALSNSAIISVRSGELNILWGGSNPTIATGLRRTSSMEPLVLYGTDVPNMRLIRNGGTDAVVDIVFT